MGAPRLNGYVHVVDSSPEGLEVGRQATFGPDDVLPDWAVASISNPDVWADGRPPAPASASPVGPGPKFTSGPAPAPAVVDVKVPPRGGAGSGRDAWATYARTAGHDAAADLPTRDEIIGALQTAGVPVE